VGWSRKTLEELVLPAPADIHTDKSSSTTVNRTKEYNSPKRKRFLNITWSYYPNDLITAQYVVNSWKWTQTRKWRWNYSPFNVVGSISFLHTLSTWQAHNDVMHLRAHSQRWHVLR